MYKILLFCFYGSLYTITIGSDTTVTRFFNQVSANNGDIVTGFSALQGGLYITDSSATVIWNALFPMSGNVTLNSGTLALFRNLCLQNIATLSSLSNIFGNNYTLDLATTLTTFIDGCNIQLVTAQSVGVQPFIGSVGWSFDDQFVALAGQARATNQIENYRFTGSTLTLLDSISGIGTQGCLAWQLNGYFLATGGTNGVVRVYSVNNVTGVLTLQSSNDQGSNVNYLAWHPTGAYLVGATNSNANEVVMYPVSNTGILGTRLNINRPQDALTCDWSLTGSYLAVGYVAAATNEVEIFLLGAGPSLTLQLGFPVGVNVNVNIIKWNPVYQDVFAVGLANTGAGQNVQIYRYNAGANTVTQIGSLSGFGAIITALDWSNTGNCLMVGIGSAVATTNKLQVYAYTNDTAALTLINGSTFINATTTSTAGRYSPLNNYIAQGASPTATTAQLRISVPGVICSTYANLNLNLHNDLVIQNCCITFTGNCMVQGNDNLLSLASTATITVGANSTLTLKNMSVQGLGSTSFIMEATSSNLILDNTKLLLDANYSFTQGSLNIINNVSISGPGNNFVYATSSTSTISAHSSLLFDNQVTFSYAPASSANNLIQCTDATSQIMLNGATLAVTTAGLIFTKGTLAINRYVYLMSDALNSSQAVRIGDGISSSNNMAVQLYPDATLDVQKGLLLYQNI